MWFVIVLVVLLLWMGPGYGRHSSSDMLKMCICHVTACHGALPLTDDDTCKIHVFVSKCAVVHGHVLVKPAPHSPPH